MLIVDPMHTTSTIAHLYLRMNTHGTHVNGYKPFEIPTNLFVQFVGFARKFAVFCFAHFPRSGGKRCRKKRHSLTPHVPHGDPRHWHCNGKTVCLVRQRRKRWVSDNSPHNNTTRTRHTTQQEGNHVHMARWEAFPAICSIMWPSGGGGILEAKRMASLGTSTMQASVPKLLCKNMLFILDFFSSGLHSFHDGKDCT